MRSIERVKRDVLKNIYTTRSEEIELDENGQIKDVESMHTFCRLLPVAIGVRIEDLDECLAILIEADTYNEYPSVSDIPTDFIEEADTFGYVIRHMAGRVLEFHIKDDMWTKNL